MREHDTDDSAQATATVAASPERAFVAFTDDLGSWWPREFTWSQEVLDQIGMEPREGGLCFERGAHGFRIDWGRVLAWQPPDRLAFSWQISPERVPEPDPAKASEVEVRFLQQGPSTTRVQLTHSHFERHGHAAAGYRAAMAGQGWPSNLARYAAHVELRGAPRHARTNAVEDPRNGSDDLLVAERPGARDGVASDEASGWGGGLWAAADLVTPMAIRVAATLRVADHIAAGRGTPDALAAAVEADGDALTRVLAHLVSAGVLTRDPTGAYSLTGLGEHLRDDDPDGVRAWIDLDGAVGRADLSLVWLLHTVRTGGAGFPRQYGRPFWEDLSADAGRSASFDALMGAQLAAEAPAVAAAAYDWEALGHVVDVGGGNGSLLIALLRAQPGLRGTVLDLAGPIAAAERAIEAADLADRADTATGSFFGPLPAGAGGYLLSEVLHDWDDRDAQRILQRCAAAATPDGAVLVVEGVDADRGATPSTEMDLRMLTYFRGRERSLDQLSELAATAGLHVTSVTPARSRSIIEMHPIH